MPHTSDDTQNKEIMFKEGNSVGTESKMNETCLKDGMATLGNGEKIWYNTEKKLIHNLVFIIVFPQSLGEEH